MWRVAHKITKMLLLVIGCFYVSWLPFTAWTMYVVFVHDVTRVVVETSVVVNPVIYATRNNSFSATFKFKLRCGRRGYLLV